MGEPGQPLVEAPLYGLGGQQLHAGSGQLQGQGQAIESGTKLSNRGGVARCEGKIGLDGLGALDEEGHGGKISELGVIQRGAGGRGRQGLFELTRAHVPTQRLSPELERSILTIRRRLESAVHAGTRYSLVGAASILAELKALQVRPLPCARTIERTLQRHGVTLPRVRLAPLVSHYTYPAPQATDSNQVHQVDCVGPVYLLGQRKRHYIWTCKDVFDGAVCLHLSRSRKMDAVLTFLGECWKTLGRPRQVQFDNAREIVGWGPAARYLSRVLRLCLRFDVEPMLIPPAKPERQGTPKASKTSTAGCSPASSNGTSPA